MAVAGQHCRLRTFFLSFFLCLFVRFFLPSFLPSFFLYLSLVLSPIPAFSGLFYLFLENHRFPSYDAVYSDINLPTF